MAIKISELPEATSTQDTDLLGLTQDNLSGGYVSKKITVGNVKSSIVSQTGVITCNFDGFGSVLAPTLKTYVQIPFACTINYWTLISTLSGSLVVDIWKDTLANYPPTVADTIIPSGTKPTLTASTNATSSDLTGWTTTIAAGDVVCFNIDSCSVIKKATIILKVTK